MQLLKKLGPRKTATATSPVYWGIFFCPVCKRQVERNLHHGHRNPHCGCARNVKHGHAAYKTRHPLYAIWGLMKGRCNNPRYDYYDRYGGRGITVCEEWSESYILFYQWAIANGWQKGLELDRIDNNGNYEPTNCRFVTGAENVQNSTSAKLNPAVVIEIRKKYAQGLTNYNALGRLYNVTGAAISKAVRRITWKNIP